ncbi:MAG: exodeoxyribonuclease III [Alphaproteobacteria bacterium]|nr:exodeoxyribonuclease III [Alphaproteobacteria bacterium]
MRIVTFNVNSIRAHLENVLNWLDQFKPDVLLLQELKCQSEQFPYAPFEDRGYNIEVFGQKSWNGIAILSKFPIEDVTRNIPGFEDVQSRYIEAFTGGVRVASCYMPNGNPIDTPKFDYKLDWMKALTSHLEILQTYDEPIVVAGDFNVVPKDRDAKNIENLRNDAITQPPVRHLFEEWTEHWTDALRSTRDEDIYYTFFDYRAGGRQRGILLDFFLLNKQAKEMLKDSGIDETPRDQPKPSDHVPAWIEL